MTRALAWPIRHIRNRLFTAWQITDIILAATAELLDPEELEPKLDRIEPLDRSVVIDLRDTPSARHAHIT